MEFKRCLMIHWYLLFALFSLSIPIYYADKLTPLIVVLLASISLVISTSIPFLIIYDLRKEPLELEFRVIYWVLFSLGWVLIPYTQSVIKEQRKAHAANQNVSFFLVLFKGLKAYLRYYIVLGLVAGVGLIVLIIYTKSIHLDFLPKYCMAISNLYGILLSLLCMGHGLIEIPKNFFVKASIKAPKFKMQLLSHLPYFRDYFNEAQRENHQMVGIFEYKSPSALTDDGIKLQRAHAQYSTAMYDLLLIEDRERLLDTHSFKMSGHLMLYRLLMLKDSRIKHYLIKYYSQVVPRVEGFYFRVIYTPLYYLLFIITTLLSILVLYYQTVQPFFPNLIPINFYNPDKDDQDVPVLMISMLLYMFYVTITTLYNVKIANLAMYPHSTDSYALLFSTVYTTRVVFPIALNFVKISFGSVPIKEQRELSDFLKVMGNIDLVPILGDLNDYISFLLIILVLLNIFKVYDKVIALFQFEPELDIEEGKMILRDNMLTLERLCRDVNIADNNYVPFQDEERLLTLSPPKSPPNSPPKRIPQRVFGKQ